MTNVTGRGVFVRRMMSRWMQLFPLFLLVALGGCVISPRRPVTGGSGSPTPTPTPGTATGKLYVTNQNTNAILRFDNALTTSGNVTPSATISGNATGLIAPQYLALDVAANRLFVANVNGSSVVIFDNISTTTGNAQPTRSIAGPLTGLINPSDVALDKGRDVLYVLDGPEILVFNSISNAATNGNVQPQRDITLSINGAAIFLDATNDRLYVADSANNAIDVFDNASALNGATGAVRAVTGSVTRLAQPSGVTLDPAGNLVVSNLGNGSITVYSNAATANGNPAPIATLVGSATTLVNPAQIIRNTVPAAGEVFVADATSGEVAVFSSVSAANGNTAPVRRIAGSATGLAVTGAQATARGVALDTTR